MVVSEADVEVETIVVTDSGQRVGGDILGRGLLHRYGLRLGLAGRFLGKERGGGAHRKGGNGEVKRQTCWETHRFQDYRTVPRADKRDRSGR